jgi:hypothetical protein
MYFMHRNQRSSAPIKTKFPRESRHWIADAITMAFALGKI